MKQVKANFIISLIVCLVFYISGCGFDDPYAPESVGSSTINGRIVTDPITDISGAEVILRGDESLSTIADVNARFNFSDVKPGSYTLQLQKSPYLQSSTPITVAKLSKQDMGDVKVKLLGAISGTVSKAKLGTLYGEFEIVVYVDGVPSVPLKNANGDYVIGLSASGNDINIRTVTKTIVYIDGTPYSAKVLDEGQILVEFVPPGIYNDVSVKMNTGNNTLSLAPIGPIVVNSGETRILSTVF
jgi:hypothetical protein